MADIMPYVEIIAKATGGDQVRDAIIDCMNEINKDAAFKVVSKTITGKLSEINNGSPYKAGTGTVWKDVTINILDDSGQEQPQSTIETEDFTVDNNTENGSYEAPEGKRWGTIYVNLDFSAFNDDIADNVVISTDDLDETNTAHAEAYGYRAFASLTFSNVDSVGAKGGYVGPGGVVMYPITFVDQDGTYIDKKDVERNTAVDTDIPQAIIDKHQGQTFQGWSGSGTAQRAETVRAQWGNPTISMEEIQHDWKWIIDHQAEIPLGAFRSMYCPQCKIYYAEERKLFPWATEEQIPSEGYYYYTITVYLAKMASGEHGSKSTWVSCIPSVMTADSEHHSFGLGTLIPYHILNVGHNPDDDEDYWAKCNSRIWLRNIFRNYVLEPNIRSHIIQVEKSFKVRTEDNVLINQPVNDTIWTPSVKEMYMPGWDDEIDTTVIPSAAWTDEQYNNFISDATGVQYCQRVFGQDGIARSNWFWKLAQFPNMGAGSSSRDQILEALYGNTEFAHVLAGQVVNNKNISYMPKPYDTRAYDCQPGIFGFCLG